MKTTETERGKYCAKNLIFKKKEGRFILKVFVPDLDKNISVDIHDDISETVDTSNLSSKLLNEKAPNRVYINNYEGYWKINNTLQFLSDLLSY